MTGGTAIIFYIFGGCQIVGALLCLLTYFVIKMDKDKAKDCNHDENNNETVTYINKSMDIMQENNKYESSNDDLVTHM